MRKSVEKSTDFFIFMWLFNCILTVTVPFSIATPRQARLHYIYHTMHSALCTLHSALRTLHSALCTPHSALRTPHSALRTPHSALRTLHSALPLPHLLPHLLERALFKS